MSFSASAEKALAQNLKEFKQNRMNRRNFMTGLSVAAAAGAGVFVGCSSGGPVTVTAAAVPASDILNFALNLEYLEATFYSYITTGHDLDPSLTGGGPAPQGAPSAAIDFTGLGAGTLITDTINEIGYDEFNHVANIRTILTANVAIPRPQLNLAAMGAITEQNVLALARAFEDTGVTAYAGQASNLSGSNATLAAQILAVEGFHAATLRFMYLLTGSTGGVVLDAIDVPVVDPGSAAKAIDGPIPGVGGIFATVGTANAVPNQSQVPGVAYARTTSQVLSIVYGGNQPAGTTKGGFFPNGVGGNINTV